MAKESKNPSLSPLAALITLAVSLWMEVDLANALFRSVLVYLGCSLLIMVYRIVLGRFLAESQAKMERELLLKAQKEAEEETGRKNVVRSAAQTAKRTSDRDVKDATTSRSAVNGSESESAKKSLRQAPSEKEPVA